MIHVSSFLEHDVLYKESSNLHLFAIIHILIILFILFFLCTCQWESEFDDSVTASLLEVLDPFKFNAKMKLSLVFYLMHMDEELKSILPWLV